MFDVKSTANRSSSYKAKPQALAPQNFEEKLVWYGVIGTYAMYFTGTLYLGIPVIAWAFFLYTLKKIFLPEVSSSTKPKVIIPLGVWIWIVSAIVIGIALIVGYYELGFGLTNIIKAIVNSYTRKWIFLLIFPLAGCLSIRPEIIYRSVNILACQSLALIPVVLVLRAAGVETPLYENTLLAKIGGLGDVFYSVVLYGAQGEERFVMFAPWPPALALVANVNFWLSFSDSNKPLKWIGMVTSALLAWFSVSRLGIILIVTLPIVRFLAINILKPRTQIIIAISAMFSGVFSFQIRNLLSDLSNEFTSQRASSSRVRDLLYRMTIYRIPDHPIWGHAFLKPEGPNLVAGMPIGSHHTWFGILYAHGIVGFVALVLPFTYTTIDLFFRAQFCKIAQTALMIMIVLLAFSFAENLEGLTYLYWPGMILFGIAMKQPIKSLAVRQQASS